jgi:5-methyltetrahydropteroyltriglutamate--homocysteine methyltransferase
MSRVRTALTGPFPRSEAIVAATRDLDRGRTTPEAVEELFRRGESEVDALEARLGLDVRSGGYLRWADLFRPFAETWGGFTVGPITRYFETNTFYRQPILHSPPVRTPGAIAKRLPARSESDLSNAKVTLPGPYTFSGMLDNRSGETREALTHRLGRLLSEEVRDLYGAGYRTFQFQEPLLVVDPPQGPLAEAAVASYRSISQAAKESTTIVWTYFADARPAFPLLDRLPVTVVGVDLAETEPSELPVPSSPRAIGFGCIDPRTTLLETPDDVVRIVRDAFDRFDPPALWLGPGAPLDLLPYRAATRKLELLPAVRQRLDGEGRKGP